MNPQIKSELDLAWEAHSDNRNYSAFEHLHNAVRELAGEARPAVKQPDNEDVQAILQDRELTEPPVQ